MQAHWLGRSLTPKYLQPVVASVFITTKMARAKSDSLFVDDSGQKVSEDSPKMACSLQQADTAKELQFQFLKS